MKGSETSIKQLKSALLGRFFTSKNLPIKIVGKRLDKWGGVVYDIAS